jgi:hypothetical protein
MIGSLCVVHRQSTPSGSFQLLSGVAMNISVYKHCPETLLSGVVEATRVVPDLRILVGAEQHVPPCKVAIIILVIVILVMNSVRLRALEDVTHPLWRPDVRMIEELPQSCAGRINRTTR